RRGGNCRLGEENGGEAGERFDAALGSDEAADGGGVFLSQGDAVAVLDLVAASTDLGDVFFAEVGIGGDVFDRHFSSPCCCAGRVCGDWRAGEGLVLGANPG